MARCWLFQPLQGGIQATIDQRFSRCKYDVARTLAAFSATLRHEVDLRQLSEHVVALVQETMQMSVPAAIEPAPRIAIIARSKPSVRRANRDAPSVAVWMRPV